MNTGVRQNFINNVNMSGFVQSGVMQSVSFADHSVKRRNINENKDEYIEIVVGKTKVGERCCVGGKTNRK